MTARTVYGVIGLGRMGSGVVARLRSAGAGVVTYDLSDQALRAAAEAGAIPAESPAGVVRRLPQPRVLLIMVPAGEPVDAVLAEVTPVLAPGDVVVDGGNSFYRDSIRRAAELKQHGVYFLDCGTSGGVEGTRSGLCLMVGGEAAAFRLAEPLLRAMARPGGYGHLGPSGSGHFVKMVHNAIEYGMLQAIGEGFELLAGGPYDLDLRAVAHLWNQGSVVRGWLMELAEQVFAGDPRLEQISGDVGGGSTGYWAIEEAWKAGVPLPAIALSYSMRLRSRQKDTFTGKVVAALRRQFGGHPVKPSDGGESGVE